MTAFCRAFHLFLPYRSLSARSRTPAAVFLQANPITAIGDTIGHPPTVSSINIDVSECDAGLRPNKASETLSNAEDSNHLTLWRSRHGVVFAPLQVVYVKRFRLGSVAALYGTEVVMSADHRKRPGENETHETLHKALEMGLSAQTAHLAVQAKKAWAAGKDECEWFEQRIRKLIEQPAEDMILQRIGNHAVTKLKRERHKLEVAGLWPWDRAKD